ncbi:MAG: DUF7133 domain-containing protein, partial [Gemmataceae bacterium]
MLEGNDYGWRLAPGARCCRPDHLRGAVAGERLGMVAPMVKTGRGSPAGVLIYHDTRLPEKYRGLIYYPDVFRKSIRAYRTKPAGSSYAIDAEIEILKSEDPLFRPCQMITGPDGAIYICDWRTDSGGAGKLWGDGKNGRIYRLSWIGTSGHDALPVRSMDSWAKIRKDSVEGLLQNLSAADFTDRVVARDELIHRGPAARDAVLSAMVSGKFAGAGRLPAMGVLQAHWTDDVEDLFRLLTNDANADVRRHAVDALAQHPSKKPLAVQDALVRLLNDHDSTVRRSCIMALARLGGDGNADTILNAWKNDDGKDPFLSDGYLHAFERLGTPGMNALLSLADSGNARDRDRVALAFTGLRSREAATALNSFINNQHLLPGQRADL